MPDTDLTTLGDEFAQFLVYDGLSPDRAKHQMILRFPNQYGASIILGEHTYGVEVGLLAYDGPDKFDYDLTRHPDFNGEHQVKGWNDRESLLAILRTIKALPPSRYALRLDARQKSIEESQGA